MAIIHRAELRPTKPEILRAFLADRSWGEAGEPELLGAYRFDDPDGEVGVECHLARVGETVYHLPLTYRPAPLPDAEEHLLTTMQHSVLGERFVYDGLNDDLALDCFLRALCGQQEQAELQIVERDGAPAGMRPQTVVLRLETDEGEQAPTDEDLLSGTPFTIARTLGDLDGAVRLVATWDGGEGVVAAV
ncbi:maltokinase N-terminal cap-like domain-containing protein [Brachybacterium sp. AOP43-C2-M15]|uniref:maltokinase N-terminal cap-like domain-containing protein n=1 Tax=Brachybacterium sp. AOP43-C2-M15 TaxID=3457661 RepID=UPI0040343C25